MAAARTSFRNRFSMRWGSAKRRFHYNGLADALGLIANFQLRRRTPQTLEIIEAPRLFAKHMHDEPTEIEQRPLRGAASFAMFGRSAKFFVKLLFDLRANRLHLRRAEACADHEVRGKRSDFAQVDHRDCGRFFVLCGLDCDATCFWQRA